GASLEGATVFSVLVDSTGPALAAHSESPRAPLPRGRAITLSLEFDESLKSAEIDGKDAKLRGRVAEATLQTPDRGNVLAVAWKAVDRFDNETGDSFTLALEPPPELARSKPSPPKPAEPARTEVAQAPQGCTAIGDAALSIGGKRFAKRVQHDLTKIHLVLIPPGSFTMGSRLKEDHAPPPRTVTLTRGFYMSEDEVSVAEYARGLHNTVPADDPRMPVSNLSWSDADRFCDATKLALPTEAEWEYACRAGTETVFAFGDELRADEASTSDLGGELRACGKSERNAFGLADMHGNLKEYCADSFLDGDEYAKLAATDPLGKRGKGRTLRGGSSKSLSKFCTSAFRQGVDEKQPQPDRGLRVVLRIP
ncbi:MAG TPA: formylglycine-generating enzyme family protein, partial [Planctomycetota bacterium]|nr:formylglycine-generating enzyme family protein [Planctomycetota bacterium]